MRVIKRVGEWGGVELSCTLSAKLNFGTRLTISRACKNIFINLHVKIMLRTLTQKAELKHLPLKAINKE